MLKLFQYRLLPTRNAVCLNQVRMFITFPIDERCIVMTVSLCLLVREYISGTACPIFAKFLTRFSNVRGWVLLWRGVAICYVLPVL